MNTIGRWGEDRFSIVFISFFLSFALLGLPSPTLAISLIFDGVCNRSLVVILPDWIPDMFSITERIGQISQFLIVPVVDSSLSTFIFLRISSTEIKEELKRQLVFKLETRSSSYPFVFLYLFFLCVGALLFLLFPFASIHSN